jgi:hypothetical protein
MTIVNKPKEYNKSDEDARIANSLTLLARIAVCSHISLDYAPEFNKIINELPRDCQKLAYDIISCNIENEVAKGYLKWAISIRSGNKSKNPHLFNRYYPQHPAMI